MKYTNEIEINLARNQVIELFDNPDNMEQWQPGFLGMEHISGVSGTEGARSKLVYQMGKRRVEMIETIIKRSLPDEFSGTYETKGVFNIVSNRFEDLEGNKTKWISENEFQFQGMMKLMAFFMPKAFSKQSLKYMKLFKEFAESSI